VPKGVVNELRDYVLPTNINVRSLSSVAAAYVQGALDAIMLAKELMVECCIGKKGDYFH
jgi:hypothetical protein